MIDQEELTPFIEGNAHIVKKAYPSIETEDVSQEMWMWAYSNEDSIDKFLAAGEDGRKLLSHRIRSEGFRYAQREIAYFNGVEYEDFHVYTPGSLRLLLADVFDHENWQSGQTFYDVMPKAKAQTNMTGDRVAMLSDVSRVLPRLDVEQHDTLVWVFKYGWSYEQLGDYLGISMAAARKRTDRAIGKVRSLLMNTEKDTDQPEEKGQHVGRRSVSNSTSMSYQSNVWDG